MNEIRVIAYSAKSISKTLINKIFCIPKENNFISNLFQFDIKEFSNFLNDFEKNKNLTSIMKFIENWIRSSCTEMEIWYDKQINLFNENFEYSNKIKTLENNLQDLTLNNQEKYFIQRKLNQNLTEIQEENNTLNDDIKSLEKQCEDLVGDYKQGIQEIKNKLEEIADLKNQIKDLNNFNQKINQNIKEKDNALNLLTYQIQASEDRIIIISKEKKNLENLINRLAKSHPAKEIQFIINEMLNNYESISQLEREKFKNEQCYNDVDTKCREIKSDVNISTDIMIEKENLIVVLDEIEQKLSNFYFSLNFFR